MSDGYSSLIERLRQRFPTLQPVASAPGIFLLRKGGVTYASKDRDLGLPPPVLPVGTGLGLTGKRDVDAQSGTYIKTRVLCFSSIPILFLEAYRVLDWERGLKQASDPNDRNETAAIVRQCHLIGPWYVIGKEPLSMLAKTWNAAVIVLVVVLVFMLAR
jgi:hypothetical protein